MNLHLHISRHWQIDYVQAQIKTRLCLCCDQHLSGRSRARYFLRSLVFMLARLPG
jgi:hypothetical protein